MEEKPASEGDSFYKYPKTPHVFGSATTDDDEISSDQDVVNAIRLSTVKRVVVQEKVDGSNMSVHFEEEWNPILQKRSGLILQKGERQQYNLWKDYVWSNLEMFWNMLGTKYCLFGEGVWQQHSVSYNSLPNFFIAFDILDKATGKFLSHNKFLAIVGGKLPVVPLLQTWETKSIDGNFKPSVEFQKLVSGRSAFGTEQKEGVYIRLESDDVVLFRFKLRRKTFVSGRADFDKNPLMNKLIT